MKKITILLFISLLSGVLARATQQPERFIAVTIDDLPVVSTRKSLSARQEITRKLLKQITAAEIPAIGFVNENKLYANGKLVTDEVNLLQRWLDAKLELGNHTFSHPSLHNVSIEKYEEEILRGEIVTKELLQARNKQIRYFRHPYLQTGLSLEIKAAINEFLAKHNYIIAPITIDNADWIFARAYDNAFERRDKKMLKKIGAAYVQYLESKMDYWERQSVKLFGRELRQILLLHANAINADYFDDIARMLKKRGYKFVPLEKALTDEAYKLPDTFTRKAGISWLHRWALARGKEFVLPNEPLTPDFIMKIAGVESE